ncbi:Hypp648 [Branchiostoma lanceolatum]|uniref:Hypp648 protein n=1 Tax=Branchiostoma lanceolatum TaxID=7740 RepID=A0A8J9VVV4_BRALA|nr:Hypp648 [Branchiostoma lanceolatum]
MFMNIFFYLTAVQVTPLFQFEPLFIRCEVVGFEPGSTISILDVIYNKTVDSPVEKRTYDLVHNAIVGDQLLISGDSVDVLYITNDQGTSYVPVAFCHNNTCQDHATCLLLGNSTTCVCQDGFVENGTACLPACDEGYVCRDGSACQLSEGLPTCTPVPDPGLDDRTMWLLIAVGSSLGALLLLLCCITICRAVYIKRRRKQRWNRYVVEDGRSSLGFSWRRKGARRPTFGGPDLDLAWDDLHFGFTPPYLPGGSAASPVGSTSRYPTRLPRFLPDTPLSSSSSSGKSVSRFGGGLFTQVPSLGPRASLSGGDGLEDQPSPTRQPAYLPDGEPVDDAWDRDYGRPRLTDYRPRIPRLRPMSQQQRTPEQQPESPYIGSRRLGGDVYLQSLGSAPCPFVLPRYLPRAPQTLPAEDETYPTAERGGGLYTETFGLERSFKIKRPAMSYAPYGVYRVIPESTL